MTNVWASADSSTSEILASSGISADLDNIFEALTAECTCTPAVLPAGETGSATLSTFSNSATVSDSSGISQVPNTGLLQQFQTKSCRCGAKNAVYATQKVKSNNFKFTGVVDIATEHCDQETSQK